MSNWTIAATEHTAIGELQQDSGVAGALPEINRIQPEPSGMQYDDNSTNSTDQENALKHWMDRIDDLTTQQVPPAAIVAKIADQGCPEAQQVYKLWERLQQHQPENDPTEDLTQVPPPEDPAMTPAPQDVAQGAQQPLASTKKTAYDVNTVREWIQKGVPEASILYELSLNGEEYLYDEATGNAQAAPGAPAPAPQQGQGFSLRDRIQQRAKTAGPNNDFAMPNADTMEMGQAAPGMQPEPVAPTEDFPRRSDDPANEIQLALGTMRDMGYFGDAEQWEAELENYHPEDYEMVLHDIMLELDRMELEQETDEEFGVQSSVKTGYGFSGLEEGGAPSPSHNHPSCHGTCPTCNGFGKDQHGAPCPHCNATGHVDGETPLERAMRDDGSTMTAKTADLAGSGPRRDKANEIYKAIRRDSDHSKSEAAAIANDSANKLEKKGDLELGNDDDKKKDDDDGEKKGNPFAKKDKDSDSDDKGSDKSDSDKDKDDDDKPAFLKKKDSRASYQGLNGVIASVYSDVWGSNMVVLATEDGDLHVPAEHIEAPVGEESIAPSPVSEIDHFLSIIDPAGHVPHTIEARIANLNQVVAACKSILVTGSASLQDQMALDERSLNARLEIAELRRTADTFSDEEQAYLDSLPQYEMHAAPQADMGRTDEGGWLDDTYNDMIQETEAVDYDQMVAEQPALLVNDMPDAVVGDEGAAEGIARSYIEAKTTGLPVDIRKEIHTAFVHNTEMARRNALARRKTAMQKRAAADIYTGPDEGLFL